ncbi:MAG: hypothetical protein OEZ02_00105 [Anaerolineae bacterium]|nr:hypothetical protein [Anaerolineae bacterium]
MKTKPKIIRWLLEPGAKDPIVTLLQAWRLWVTAALLGAILAAGVYALFPPPFQAHAAVVVDHNLEQAWQYFPDRQLFYFLNRETRKLEALAWADATLQLVVKQVPGTTIADLRADTLKISYPAEGVWHFWAQASESHRAQTLAGSWAAAFVTQVKASIEVSPELETARAALLTAAVETPPDPQALEQLAFAYGELIDQTAGISPYLEVSVSQGQSAPLARSLPHSTYLLVGSVLGACLLALLVLFSVGSTQGPRTDG